MQREPDLPYCVDLKNALGKLYVVGGGWRPNVYVRGIVLLYRVGAPLGAALGRCPVAVAGTRNPTAWGKHAAREVGRALAEAGYAVVTGFARGVDEEATTGALGAGGRVVAVLPYLFEADGKLSARAAQLLRAAASRGALVVKDVGEALSAVERRFS